MICPHCGGKGQILSKQLVAPCEYPGCHCGHLHCCDPQQAEQLAEKVSMEGINFSNINDHVEKRR